MKSLILTLAGAAVGAGGMWAMLNGASAQNAMQKPAYLIVLGDVYDSEAFMTGYSANLAPLYEKYGGEYLAVGRNKAVLENGKEFQSFVISKWPSMEAAQAFWADPDYEQLKADRIDKGWSEFDVYLLEGLPEAPPE